jgi:protein-S-isoprenylcysteine O-methyltransferase Ste14
MVEIEKRKQVIRLKLISRALLNCLLALIFFGLPLFLPAHSLRFWNAWLFLGVFITSMFSILIYLFIKDPVLMEKRMRGNEKENPQKLIMTFLVLDTLLSFTICGFDYRFHWSSIPVLLTILSAFIMICGFIMLFLVTLQNSYASRIIEIQEEQILIDTGFYSKVRHPMYLAFSIIFLVTPIMLGSYYALIPISLIPLLIAMRIGNEEKLLQKSLKGYDLYMKKVKYRLIPFIW